ncbi:hypothetical protein HDU92_004759 [Lobulomyces angularis]|nr:hypothetical protein HDU92_004759 [Lobulomyces angularis]
MDFLLNSVRATIWYTRTSPVFEGSMQDKYIQATNAWRAIKGLNPLVYDPDLNSTPRENNRVSSELNAMGHHVTGGPGTVKILAILVTLQKEITNLMNPDYTRIGGDENGAYGICTYGMCSIL